MAYNEYDEFEIDPESIEELHEAAEELYEKVKKAKKAKDEEEVTDLRNSYFKSAALVEIAALFRLKAKGPQLASQLHYLGIKSHTIEKLCKAGIFKRVYNVNTNLVYYEVTADIIKIYKDRIG